MNSILCGRMGAGLAGLYCAGMLLGIAPAQAIGAEGNASNKADWEMTGEAWVDMNYGPYLTASLEIEAGNIAEKGVAIRLDQGSGGISHGHEFVLFDTDTLRYAAGWKGGEFIDWRNILFNGEHGVHASIVGEKVFKNPDHAGWADPETGRFIGERVKGRDGKRYGPLARDWAHWKGLYLHKQQVVLSYTVGETALLESPAAEGSGKGRAFSRTLNVQPHDKSLVMQVASREGARIGFRAVSKGYEHPFALLGNETGEDERTAVAIVGGMEGLEWIAAEEGELRLKLPPAKEASRLKLLYGNVSGDDKLNRFKETVKASPSPIDLEPLTNGGPPRWEEEVTTKKRVIGNPKGAYVLEAISVPQKNPYHARVRPGGFDFFKRGDRAAVCTWDGDVWIVSGLGGKLEQFTWDRVATGMFQPLGLKIIDGKIYVCCRDQITRLHDLNEDGEIDFYENFNNDHQVTEHFHEFAMNLETDGEGNLYYTKAGRHAKDALVPHHGTLLRVSPEGGETEIVANGFRAPNGLAVNGDGSFVVSDQEGHWTPENRINWVKPGGFYGYMMGYHKPGLKPSDSEEPLVWVHKEMDRSPADQVWVESSKWGLAQGDLISLSYGTGEIFRLLHEKVGTAHQGGLVRMPIAETFTGVMRGRFHPTDGQLYACGLVGWSTDKVKPGGFYRVRYTGKPLYLPNALHATEEGIMLGFTRPLDPKLASDPGNYGISRWTYKRDQNYGGDDYKLSNPDEEGRDTVDVTAVKVSNGNKAVFLEIPDMRPCRQMAVQYNLESADGKRVSHRMLLTVNKLVEHYGPFEP